MLLSEKIFTFAEAAKHLPRIDGRRPHTSTVWRWARRGIGGVRLECLRVGGRYVTSAEALERFAEQLARQRPQRRETRRRDPPHRHAAKRSDTQRRRDIDDATRELEQDGM